jgi:tetratricopeptide (TPR) repeat protein
MKKGFLSVVLASLLAVTSINAQSSEEVNRETVHQAKVDAKSHYVKLIEEAVNALALTQKVLIELNNHNIEGAIKTLEDAIGKLEVVLANKNAPKLLPVDNKVIAIEYAGDLETLKKSVEKVKELINDGKLQDARLLLNTLQSQINILTVSIPLITYPDALKLAAKYLHEGKVAEAAVILETALSTLVEEKVVIPLPILKAEGLIKAASVIAKKDKEQALKHLEQAKRELAIAETLGYISESDTTYKMLATAIEEIEKEIKGKNEAEKLFEALIEKIKEFKEKAVKTFGGLEEAPADNAQADAKKEESKPKAQESNTTKK